MALLPGGGYAELAVVHHGSAMHVPAALSDAEAAALPEVYLTAFLNLFMLAGVKAMDSALIHGGGSGVGTASIQLLGLAQARSIVTAGTDGKCEECLRHGADIAINYNSGPFAPKVRSSTNGRGCDVILDSIGGAYLAQNLEALANGGRLILIGLMKGAKAELDLATVLRRQLENHRLNPAYPPGRGKGRNRHRLPCALRRGSRSRPTTATDLPDRAADGRCSSPSHDAGQRALRQNRPPGVREPTYIPPLRDDTLTRLPQELFR